ncbi:hypothetical protein K466DRAFT_374481 [Polyporus arcularius HHB13444]|uniref:Uncharacterized protein n=1 Tax=Polyporus arcularius HHB13444 TaxID=1314778 RepID=A0A5C3PM65_9APHY|nr:hypothetical protein K466DRAFT_374481 [Polyporus arcularius HHB13444]
MSHHHPAMNGRRRRSACSSYQDGLELTVNRNHTQETSPYRRSCPHKQPSRAVEYVCPACKARIALSDSCESATEQSE